MKYILIGFLLSCFVLSSLANVRFGADDLNFFEADNETTTDNPTTESQTTESETTKSETTSEATTAQETTTRETTKETTMPDVTTHEQNTTYITTEPRTTKAKSDKFVKEGTFVAVTVVLSVIIAVLGVTLLIMYVKCRQRSPYGSLK